jgi:hypothetical protein
MSQAHPPSGNGKRTDPKNDAGSQPRPQPHPHIQSPARLSPAGAGRVRGDFDLSRHAEDRARQRGYRESDIELIVDFGTPVHDGYMVTPRDVEAFEAWAKQTAVRMRKLSGSFVSVDQSTITSVYRPAKPKRRRLLDEAV